jgi:hypothetical protein
MTDDESLLNPTEKQARDIMKKRLGVGATITKVTQTATDVEIEIYSPNPIQWDQEALDAAAFEIGQASKLGLKLKIATSWLAPNTQYREN